MCFQEGKTGDLKHFLLANTFIVSCFMYSYLHRFINIKTSVSLSCHLSPSHSGSTAVLQFFFLFFAGHYLANKLPCSLRTLLSVYQRCEKSGPSPSCSAPLLSFLLLLSVFVDDVLEEREQWPLAMLIPALHEAAVALAGRRAAPAEVLHLV